MSKRDLEFLLGVRVVVRCSRHILGNLATRQRVVKRDCFHFFLRCEDTFRTDAYETLRNGSMARDVFK